MDVVSVFIVDYEHIYSLLGKAITHCPYVGKMHVECQLDFLLRNYQHQKNPVNLDYRLLNLLIKEFFSLLRGH